MTGAAFIVGGSARSRLRPLDRDRPCSPREWSRTRRDDRAVCARSPRRRRPRSQQRPRTRRVPIVRRVAPRSTTPPSSISPIAVSALAPVRWHRAHLSIALARSRLRRDPVKRSETRGARGRRRVVASAEPSSAPVAQQRRCRRLQMPSDRRAVARARLGAMALLANTTSFAAPTWILEPSCDWRARAGDLAVVLVRARSLVADRRPRLDPSSARASTKRASARDDTRRALRVLGGRLERQAALG